MRKDSSFVFTLTDKDTSKTRYGICHNFYLGDGESRGSLTSMCILTNHQFISGFRTVLATLKKIIDSGTVLFKHKDVVPSFKAIQTLKCC